MLVILTPEVSDLSIYAVTIFPSERVILETPGVFPGIKGLGESSLEIWEGIKH